MYLTMALGVYDNHLSPGQQNRYKKRNVHEAEEEVIFVEIIRAIPANGCFVNIGSAIGYYPILAKILAPELTIHAIEPLERHRTFFIENIILNGLSQTDFTIHREGVSSSDGEARFVDSGYGSSIQRDGRIKQGKMLKSLIKGLIKTLLARTGLKKYQTISKNTITIKTITLDNLTSAAGRYLDLLLMDVQGFEVYVLKGALHTLQTGSVKTFLIGTHSQKLHQECIDILRENGYIMEFDKYQTKEQPDEIIVGSKGVRTLSGKMESKELA